MINSKTQSTTLDFKEIKKILALIIVGLILKHIKSMIFNNEEANYS